MNAVSKSVAQLIESMRLGTRRLLPAAAVMLLAACGGGGDGGAAPAGGGPADVTISGTVTFDYVPSAAVGGLDYSRTEARPARRVSVQFISGATVLASSQTDVNGEYRLSVPPSRNGFVRALAESVTTTAPRWDFRVADNTSGDVVYAIDGEARSSGTEDSVRDLHAASGWTGNAYGAERAAAPFAILDTVYRGGMFIGGAGAGNLPPLTVNWSPDNIATFAASGQPDPDTGEIGTSFYQSRPAAGIDGIYLLGDEDSDTEEYDPHVILHEFAHYLEWQLGRIESIGGPHVIGDRLDLRVAFSEGWATAFAALVLDDPTFVDSGGFRQQGAFSFDVEGDGSPNPAPGWYSEQSVWEFIYDLADSDADGNDVLSYSIGDLWSVMSGPIVTTPATVAIFPFLNAIKSDFPGDTALIDLLAGDQAIASVTDDFGSGETNDAGSADVLPVYAELTVNGPPVNVCSTDEFSSAFTGSVNKLSSRRLLRFAPPFAGTVTIDVTATDVPDGNYADPDWVLHRLGPFLTSEDEPTAACQDIDDPSWTPARCSEPGAASPAATVSVINAEYLLEVFEWTNTQDALLNPDFAPIGRTCFDVTVTQP